MRILLRSVVAAAVALGGFLVAVPGAVGATTDDGSATTVTWTVQPATADGPDGRISLRHVLDPGASVTEHVTVTNFSDRAATFLVYAGDGTLSDSGDFDVPPGGAPQDGGAWIALSPPEGAEALDDGRLSLTLAGGAAATVPLTITVPADATPGDHPAGVVAELVADDAVRLAARVGTRLHLRVTGDVEAALTPDDVTTRWEPSWNPFAPGTVHVRYVVRNTGDVRLGARPATTLAGPAGIGAASHTAELREVLPGQSAVVEASLPVWPVVRVTGHVDVRPWVVGEDVVDAAMRAGSAPVTVWAVPWPQLALLVLVVGAVVLVRWWRRRSARQVQARVDEALAAAGVAREPVTSTTGAQSPPP
ncbi:hypothetical protein [Cellulomonas sp. S1-8]|uniref:COG1470 family protein n=1 Tax=Cellulomonas sp. S1-8 TaxID=2904790 RepID=UPI0022445C35|nr:hypothetical protein [Cellulomonas sp. S1-8]UZN03465.1 DUF916 domain-containing protein [Cellulomonas sp. S1-8]